METVNFEISLLKEDGHAAANDAFNNIRQANRSLTSFEWEFFGSPAGQSIYIIARDSMSQDPNQIIGLQCVIPIWMQNSNGDKILTGKSEDTVVHPGYRGKGLLNLMYNLLFEECKKANIEYIWGFTSAIKPFSSLGFEIPFQLYRGYYVTKTFKALDIFPEHSNLKGKIKTGGLIFTSKLRSVKTSFISKSIVDYTIDNNNDIERSKLFSQEYLGLPSFSFILQDKEYMKWRIKDNPNPITYDSIQLLDNKSKIQGDIIYSITDSTAYIEQILIAKDLTEKTKLAFLKRAIEKIKTHPICIIRFMGINSNPINRECIELLNKTGFTFLAPNSRINSFVWKQMTENNTSIEANKLIISKLYTEGK